MGATVKLVLKPLSGHNEVDSGHGEETWKLEPNVATRLKCPCKGNIDGIVGTEEGAHSFPSPLPSSLPSVLPNGSALQGAWGRRRIAVCNVSAQHPKAD